MTAEIAFERWRLRERENIGWGLAWFLSFQFCKRFYMSHGIVPWVIEREGLGYYGIQLTTLKCAKNPEEVALGRLTMSGNAENWRSGSPGDHRMNTSEQCTEGVATERLIELAIGHLQIDLLPQKSHVGCRHQRWGGSYVLMFELSTIIALTEEAPDLQVWNWPGSMNRVLSELDPQYGMREHPAGFLLTNGASRLVLTGDGRMLDGSKRNLWLEYMAGRSPSQLAESIWQSLNVSGN